MAFIDQIKKKEIMNAIKPIVTDLEIKRNLKIRLSGKIKNNMVLTITLKSDTLSKESDRYMRIMREVDDNIILSQDDAIIFRKYQHNQLYCMPKATNDETLEFYKKINSAIKLTGEWYDNSDPMTDYFDVAFYYNVVVA